MERLNRKITMAEAAARMKLQIRATAGKELTIMQNVQSDPLAGYDWLCGLGLGGLESCQMYGVKEAE